LDGMVEINFKIQISNLIGNIAGLTIVEKYFIEDNLTDKFY